MTKQIWLNLPSKDLNKSREFYTAIGFRVNEKHTNDDMLAMHIGEDNFALMICEEKRFEKYAMLKAGYGESASEMLISFDAESRDEVDDLANKAATAGGNLFAKPCEIMGWMYGCAFADVDGHRWNVLYMDMSKMPK